MTDDNVSKPLFDRIEEDPVLSSQFDLSKEKPGEIQRGQFANWLREDIGERLAKAEKKAVWIAPFAATAGLVAGIGLIFLLITKGEHIQTDTLQRMVKDITTADQKARNERARDPELWLTYIAELMMGDQVVVAEQEFQAFRKQYPDYGKKK